MKVQKFRLPNNIPSWTVIDDNFRPIIPVSEYLRYLVNTGKSPCTIRSYANHLKLFWDYLAFSDIKWEIIKLNELANFIGWLKSPAKNINVISLPDSSRIKESSINTILSCLSSFYEFQGLIENTQVNLAKGSNWGKGNYKPLLHHIYKNRPIQRRVISLKSERSIPKTISHEQFSIILDACCNKRDMFLLSLLYDTGIRIGQALALRHSDVISWDNEIHIKYRSISINESYNKTSIPYVIHVSPELMSKYRCYIDSLTNRYNDEYVFVNLVDYKPLSYMAVNKLFIRLKKKTKINITPHMLRHTHATNLVRSGWDSSFVQKRLGHSSVQTTINVYTHLDQQSLKNAYKKYLSSKKGV